MTTPRTKPIDLTAPQSRHLSQHRRLLVVIPCVPQPPSVEDVRKLAGIDYHWMRPEPDRGMDYWRVAGPIWAVRKLTGIEPQLRSPYQPGDIVPCREEFCDTAIYAYINKLKKDRIHYAADGKKSGWAYRPASRMPLWAIRHRPVVESVECRRVGSIGHAEIWDTGIVAAGDPEYGRTPYNYGVDKSAFTLDWHRRYRRRGEAYSFDKVWGWFYTLKLTNGDE